MLCKHNNNFFIFADIKNYLESKMKITKDFDFELIQKCKFCIVKHTLQALCFDLRIVYLSYDKKIKDFVSIDYP